MAHWYPFAYRNHARAVLLAALTSFAAVALGVVHPASALEFRPSTSEYCKYEANGFFEPGDFDKLLKVSDDLIEFDGESTGKSTLCLDSPGGNFFEGMKIAKYVYDKGVGTVVGPGAQCHSVCALVFMMGMAQGPEVVHPNRKLSIDGVLGFHRPFMSLSDAKEYTSGDVNDAFDFAMEGAFEMVSLANKPVPWADYTMIMPDLMKHILETRSDDSFIIDNVDKAGRWKIVLMGEERPKTFGRAQAYIACENTLQWRVGLMAAEGDNGIFRGDIFAFNKASGGAASYIHSIPVTENFEGREGYTAFHVVSRKSGYVHAACDLLRSPSGVVTICAIDEYTGVKIGGGLCSTFEEFEERGEYINYLAHIYHDTPLFLLAKPYSEMGAVAYRANTCIVEDVAGEEIDRQSCLHLVYIDPSETEGNFNYTHVFVWPSGAKTVFVQEVSGSYTSSEGAFFINGVQTTKVTESCAFNPDTKNRFCIEP